MAIFEYKGINSSGKNISGSLDSENIRTARMKLKKDQIFVTSIRDKKKESNLRKSGPNVTANVGVKDLSLMTRQLATLIKSNIPLVDALSAVAEQVENVVLSHALSDCRNMVNEGSTLHKALAKYPNIFTNIYITMCEAGEASGSLDVILLRLAEFTEAQADLRSKVSGALIYPLLMLLVTGALLSFMFVFLVPKIMSIFDANPQLTLPWYTVLLFDISGVFVNYWWMIFPSFGLVVFLFLSWKKSPTGSKQWDAISLKIPLFGAVVRMVAVSRFTRTLETLLTGGVPMLTAMAIVRNVVGNEVIALAIDEARSNISEGESISGPLKKSEQFPPIVIHMVNIGEKTGDLENMLQQVSNAYEFQVKNKIDTLTGLMAPIITIFMGLSIGAIVLAIMIPMFDMMDSIG
ncbi:MAG TPA: type II secretion system F family protein [Pseudobdellovibrionaceae bacterium]|nr:type II secretion system F family protein [Pseudobdellovibrionaceae bacterium]